METLLFLHGFLGQGDDWQEIAQVFQGEGFKTTCPSLFSPSVKPPAATQSPSEWGRTFFRHQPVSSPLWLIGYSLGGRLALTLLKDHPEKFKGAILVSVNPGFKEDPLERRRKDLEWSTRFRDKPWSEVLADWNRQPVFAGSHSLERREADFSREALALALENWSTAEQAQFCSLEELRRLNQPLLWICGELDTKYVNLHRDLQDLAVPGQYKILPGGHRLPWDNPPAFCATVQAFINQCSPP